MAGRGHWWVSFGMLAACGFPRPAAILTEDAAAPGDAAGAGTPDGALPADGAPGSDGAQPPDGPPLPGSVIHVSPSGDDANDGMALPVKTLKHAIGLAAANPAITSIAVATGRYAVGGGEIFPYTVPPHVTIVGPAGGGAILAGSSAEPGMVVDTGALQDLELESFTVAVTATGTARVENLHIRSSALAVRAETAARLTVENLDISSVIGGCGTGIELNGAADLMATTLTTRNLETTLDAKDQTSIRITGANITGDRNCDTDALAGPVMLIDSNNSFMLADSIIDGGNEGILFGHHPTTLHASLSNSTIRNIAKDALADGGRGFTFEMTGGNLSANGRAGAEIAVSGIWTFTGVTIEQNSVFGVYVNDATLVMRNCSITGNRDGLFLDNAGAVDLGTSDSPGANTLQHNTDVGLYLDSTQVQVEAVGNTWNPGVQGADSAGRYIAATIQTTIPDASASNYAKNCSAPQCALHR
jgi:hypothetical protein